MRPDSRLTRWILPSLLGVAVTWSVQAITLPPGFGDALVATVSAPTALAFTPDGRLLITTQGGTLRVVQGGVLLGDARPVPRVGGLLERRARAPRRRGGPAVRDEPFRLPLLHVQQERGGLSDAQHDEPRGKDLALHAGRSHRERDQSGDGARSPGQRPELRGEPQRRAAAGRARRLSLRGHRRRRVRLRGRQRLRGRERRVARPEHPERKDPPHRAGRLRARPRIRFWARVRRDATRVRRRRARSARRPSSGASATRSGSRSARPTARSS